VKEVYGTDPPVTFKYDFISIKGRGGKISSSMGNVISLDDVLEVYQPEVVRYLFAGTRPNAEFAISFDLDVLKIYEDYDKAERIYFGIEEVGEKRRAKEARIYELSQVEGVPKSPPPQISFRHLCNLLQIHIGNVDEIVALQVDLDEEQRRRLRVRASCAWNWITKHSPEEFRFHIRTPEDIPLEVTPAQRRALVLLSGRVRRLDEFNEKRFADELYRIAEEAEVDSKEFFRTVYQALIASDKGPRLASFIFTLGKERVLELLSAYNTGQ
jgi:lysyl-tRNA synthetase class 1